ncbi:hypothetical protein GCM10027418_12050 [Mariniluteicoccus endophyticus]
MLAVLLASASSPAYAQTFLPEPLPRGGRPMAYAVGPRHDPRHRSESLDGTRQMDEDSKQVDVVVEASVLFGKDSDVLQPRGLDELDRIAARLAPRQKGLLEVVGHTDDLGPSEHGLDLSRRRAARVASHLRPRLPAGITLKESGMGEAQPRVPNDSEVNRAKNRRVELHLR